jgi:hypothetical protein
MARYSKPDQLSRVSIPTPNPGLARWLNSSAARAVVEKHTAEVFAVYEALLPVRQTRLSRNPPPGHLKRSAYYRVGRGGWGVGEADRWFGYIANSADYAAIIEYGSAKRGIAGRHDLQRALGRAAVSDIGLHLLAGGGVRQPAGKTASGHVLKGGDIRIRRDKPDTRTGKERSAALVKARREAKRNDRREVSRNSRALRKWFKEFHAARKRDSRGPKPEPLKASESRPITNKEIDRRVEASRQMRALGGPDRFEKRRGKAKPPKVDKKPKRGTERGTQAQRDFFMGNKMGQFKGPNSEERKAKRKAEYERRKAEGKIKRGDAKGEKTSKKAVKEARMGLKTNDKEFEGVPREHLESTWKRLEEAHKKPKGDGTDRYTPSLPEIQLLKRYREDQRRRDQKDREKKGREDG